jgi:rhodanese-related sulfurtransferase
MGRELKRVLIEALVVSALGLALALVANWVSPRGLSFARNYFPTTAKEKIPASSNVTVAAQTTNPASHASPETVAARLREKGLQPIDGEEALRLFRDPQYEQELIVFVDARDDRHYQEGHIPGAYQFDHFHPQNYLPAVLPACQHAEQIVVYCNGGNCEDSEFAALALKDAGVPQTPWLCRGHDGMGSKGRPVEVGERKSGNTRPAKP